MSAETTRPAHEHSFPRNPPGGSPLYPSPCECGVTHGQDTAQRRLATAVAAMRHAYGDGWAAAVPEDVRGELAGKLAAVAEFCRDHMNHIATAGCCGGHPQAELVRVADIVAIIGGGEEHAIPSAAALRAYLDARGWAEGPPGPAGSLWVAETGTRIGVPHDDDPFMLKGAIDRIAATEGRTARETAAAVLTAWMAGEADRG